MITQSVTVELSPTMFQRLQQAADTMHRSVEEVIEQTIQGNLPPALTDVPPALQQEAETLQRADRATLWQIAQEQVPAEQWDRHEALLNRNQSGELSDIERDELSRLRQQADVFVLRRSYALALLKWRGYALQVPLGNGG